MEESLLSRHAMDFTRQLKKTLGFPQNVYIAPSWSWASVEGQVEIRMVDARHVRYQAVSTVVDHHLEYHTSDVTGQVKFGWIKISGPLQEVRLDRPSADSKISLTSQGTSPVEHECCLDSLQLLGQRRSSTSLWW